MSVPAPRPQHARPLWLAAVLTCMVAPFVVAALHVATVTLSVAGDSRFTSADVAFVARMIALYFALTVAGVLVLGMPCVLWLRRRGALTLANLSVAGVAGGAVLGVVFAAFFLPSYGYPLIVLAISGGLVAGIVFGLLAGVPLRRAAPVAAP